MSDAFDSVNPLVWVQFRLQGGWRRLGWVCIVCVGGFVVATSAFWRISGGGQFPAFCASTLNVVGILLAVLMIVGGSNAVHRAVRKDQSTRMMESHRLSPITGGQALVGYLIGPSIQILALFVMGTLVGTYLASMAKLPIATWLVSAGFLLVAATMIWSFSLLHALSTAKGGNPMLALILVASMGGFAVVSAVPAIALVLGVNVWLFAVGQAVGAVGGGVPAHFVATFAAEAAVTGLWCFAIVRKFRRPDRPPFEVGWGFVFLLVGLLIAVGGLLLTENLTQRGDPVSPDVVIVATVLLSMLLGLVPVYGAEFARAAGRRNLKPARPPERPGFVIPLTTLIVVAAGLLMVAAWRRSSDAAEGLRVSPTFAWTIAAIVVALWFIGSAGVLRILQAIRYRAIVMPVALWAFALWGLPPFLEQIRRLSVSLASNVEPDWSPLMACSPAGALYVVWSDMKVSLWPGLVFQGIVAFGVLALGARMLNKRRKSM